MKKILQSVFSFFDNNQGQRTVMFFTDCFDSNAISRVTAHLMVRLKKHSVHCFGIKSWQEASLNIANVLEVWKKSKSTGNVVVGNIAPRQDKTWVNGAPFCFCWISGNLVVATPQCFAILVKSGLVPGNFIYQTDVKTVCSKFLNEQETSEIARTQFRSLWYVPRLIEWLLQRNDIPWEILDLQHIPDISPEIVLIDCFGNIKLSMAKNEFLKLSQNKTVIMVGDQSFCLPEMYERLSDIPAGCVGFVVGSGNEWMELVINGGDASLYFKACVGNKIKFI